MEDIYKMKLLEGKQLGDIRHPLATFVMRVPGGWIFNNYDKSSNMMSSVFVRFDNEFQQDSPCENQTSEVK